jgi:large repetitive protein
LYSLENCLLYCDKVTLLSAGLGVIYDSSLFSGVFDKVRDGSIDILAHIPTLLNKTILNPKVSLLTIPTYGLPYITTAGVEINPGQIPTAKIEIPAQATNEFQPTITSVEVQPEQLNGSIAPVLYLSGENFGTSTSNLQVDLITPNKETIQLSILPELSAPGRLAIRPTDQIALGAHSKIRITRSYQTAYQQATKFYSELVSLPDQPLYRDLSLIPQTWNNQIVVYNTTDPKSIIEASSIGSPDLLLAKIPVGKPGTTTDGPRYVAVNSSATVAYTPLEGQGRVAVIDLIALQQVNTNHHDLDPTIQLPDGAHPFSIVIDARDNYAYVADRYSVAGKCQIYVIDINPNSLKYNKHVETIQLGDGFSGLAQMAFSADNKYLFITVPSASDQQGHVIAIDVDLSNKNRPGSSWHKQVSDITTDLGVTGITAAPIDDDHPQQIQMVITNRQTDFHGFGVLTFENNHIEKATINYTALSLGSSFDYFDVNEGVAVTITKDGKYAFVAGRNSRNMGQLINSVDADSRAGSNIGIIADPLTSYSRLVAATLAVPNGWTNGLALSGNDQVLTAVYPGLNGGTIFSYDVEEIRKTIEHPEDYLDTRGLANRYFNIFNIDLINPKIRAISADFVQRMAGGGDFDFVVPQGSKNPPLSVGGNTFSVTQASDWLSLNPASPTGYIEDLTPTLSWQFDRPENVKQVNLFVSTFDVGEGLLPWDKPVDVNSDSFLSDLSPEEKEALITKPWHGYQDYNPGRILTATWDKKTAHWSLPNGTGISLSGSGDNFQLTLPDQLQLTAGSTYHWAVQAIDSLGKSIFEKGNFKTVVPKSDQFFKSVTVLTHGFNPDILSNTKPVLTNIPDGFYQLANSIIHTTKESGLMLRYDLEKHLWVPTDEKGQEISTNGLSLGSFIQSNYLGKSLVLLTDWSQESVIPNSGFTEAVADEIFAAMVSLDQMLGGSVGEQNATGQTRIYDDFGNLIRKQGDLFNSPLHFIGFSRGTVVNSEVIQRLGNYFPGAGGRIVLNNQGEIVANPDRELQMTTIDPHDFEQGNLNKGFGTILDERLQNYSNFYEPSVKVWSNVTFADNYYQTRANPSVLNAFSATPNGRILEGADINEELTDLTGFKHDNGLGNTHTRALAWYAGTVSLNAEKFNVKPGTTPPLYTAEEQTIYDALGSRALIGMNIDSQGKLGNSWYQRSAAGEGIGEGWAFSILGGGKNLRPSISNLPREDLKQDNTATARQRGDFALPTLFDGNFDTILDTIQSEKAAQLIPGWSLLDDSGKEIRDAQSHLKRWVDILPEGSPDRTTYAATINSNYAIELGGGDSLVHNNFVVPDWGALRFDVHVPNPNETNNSQTDVLRVFIDGQELYSSVYEGAPRKNLEKSIGVDKLSNDKFPAVDLRKFNKNTAPSLTPEIAEIQSNRIMFGETGFQTFQVDIPNELRGKVAKLEFKLEKSSEKTVYLDNIFFKSQHLVLGNPSKKVTTSSGAIQQEARKDLDTRPFSGEYYVPADPTTPFGDNYLLEKPQYSLSYNNSLKTANWVSYQLNKSWLGDSLKRPDFPPDPHLPFATSTRPVNSDIPETTDYQRGHMVAASHRNRNIQDYYATFLMSNFIPQPLRTPNGDRWTKLEEDLRGLVDNENKEVYIIAGRDGQTSTNLSDKNINVPSHVWKVVLIMDRPGQGVTDEASTLAFAIDLPNPVILDPEAIDQNTKGVYIGQDPDSDWKKAIVSVRDLEGATGYNFFSNITDSIQDAIETDKERDLLARIETMLPTKASLTVSIGEELSSVSKLGTFNDSSIGHSSIPNQITCSTDYAWISTSTLKTSQSQVTVLEMTDTSKASITSINSSKASTTSINSYQYSPSQINIVATSVAEIGTLKISIPQDGSVQTSTMQVGTKQIGSGQVSPSQIDFIQVGSPQINIPQIGSFQANDTSTGQTISILSHHSLDLNAVKVTLPILVSFQQFVGSNSPNSILPTHSSTSSYLQQLQSSLAAYWQTTTPINLNFVLTSLPTGQLAEAFITGYDSFGRPNTATITIDDDANGVGWFIDTTPQDNSEFIGEAEKTYFTAAPNSEAAGKYDLLTAILHEMGHALGIINGYSEFNKHIQGNQFVIDSTHAYRLSADRSHLDNSLYPGDLLNTSLKPGIRKLPSEIDLQIIKALNAGFSNANSTINPAHLSAGALEAAISNGDFSTTADWQQEGAIQILNGSATLSEQSQKLAELTQAFIIPVGAKRLQFTILNNHLVPGDSSKVANDAFEVALLDSKTYRPLVGTSVGLNHTDSLLNIQANGVTYKSNTVKITPLSSTSQIVTIDLTSLATETSATLYFNLLGFGARTSSIDLDDVKLFTESEPAPIANPDQVTTGQGQEIVFNPIVNDIPNTITSLNIISLPTHGTLSIQSSGIAYNPNAGYIGSDRFTYIIQGEDGQISNEAVVSVAIENLPPEIGSIDVPERIEEGRSVEFKATAKDHGSTNALTYSWNFGDNTAPVLGQNTTHSFVDNGNYNVVLTVTDKDGGSTTQTVAVVVDNVVPTIIEISKPDQINEGQGVEFTARAIDPASNDTLTYSWNFGDNTAPVIGQNATHAFADNGNYNVALTVTDKDGGSTTQTVAVVVDNVVPTIANITKPAQISEGQAVQFSATATDLGINDTLTYSWNFGDSTALVAGQNVSHAFADNGNYNVILTVTDKDGGVTSQTVVAKVDNVAPTIATITKPAQINEGQAVQFTATATDPGIDDTLTYSWNFGDNTQPVLGHEVAHTLVDNGTYTVILTVTDKDGGVATQNVIVQVDNVNPIIASINKPAQIKEGQSALFGAVATDPGTLDTLNYSWNFGDGTNPQVGQNVNHTFTDNGTYTVILTVTDKDGGIATQNVIVQVDNVAPLIVNITKPTIIKEGEAATFSATATDPGTLDTLTYSWNFGDNTNPQVGQNVNHTFADNGNYNVILTVTDKDGAVTTQTVIVKVDNVAPTIASMTLPQNAVAGTASQFSATASDQGTRDTLTYSWNFGDNTAPVQGQTITRSFTTPGTYNITLTDKDGAVTTQTQTLLVAAAPSTSPSGIRSGAKVTLSGSVNLDGNVSSRTDDTKIYAAAGVNTNGNITLPVKRDAAGNPIKDANGKYILIDNSITTAPGANTSNSYSNINTAAQTITIPTYNDIKQQSFNITTPPITFDILQKPINTVADWTSKFPPAGTTSNPTVVRIINGNFNLPSNITLNNYIIIVENGNINLNQGNSTLNNVTFIANNGNIALNNVTASNLKLSASGDINFAGNTTLNGNSTINSNGNTKINGNTTGNATIKIVAQGNVDVSGNSTLKGQISSKKEVTLSGKTTLVGGIDALGNITLSGNVTVAAI